MYSTVYLYLFKYIYIHFLDKNNGIFSLLISLTMRRNFIRTVCTGKIQYTILITYGPILKYVRTNLSAQNT